MKGVSFLVQFVLRYNQFVLMYLLFFNLMSFMTLILSFVNLYKHTRKVRYTEYRQMSTSPFVPPISILVPCYNEAKTVVDNVKSLLNLAYHEFEVVVINDGSTDETFEKLKHEFHLRQVDAVYKKTIPTKDVKGIYYAEKVTNLILIDKVNGGKADSLNAGANMAKYPLITAIDADSILEKDSLLRVARPFMDEPDRVVASGGAVRIVNSCQVKKGFIEQIRLPHNSLAMFQTVEYLRAFFIGRAGFSEMNGLLIISGAFGIFKKSIVQAVGGYTAETIGEDMELVVKIHKYMRQNKRKYKIVFVPDAVCWTQAPEDLQSLKGQRKRWHRGLMDSLLSHPDMLLNPRYGVVGLVIFPYYWMFEMIGPMVEITGYFVVLLSFVFGLLSLRFAILFVGISMLYGVLLSMSSIILEEYTTRRYEKVNQYVKLILYSILENFGYRQLVSWWRFLAYFGYRKKKNTWGIIGRKEL